jgi:putative SOS response-associated peptidase YedK
MCGRYTSTSTVSDLASIFEVDEVRVEPLPARYNVAPTLQVYAVALRQSRAEAGSPGAAGSGEGARSPGAAGSDDGAGPPDGAGSGRRAAGEAETGREGAGEKGPRRALGSFRWGLVPSWAKDPSVGARMINARAEGIATKPAFRAAVARRRCLIPADAFYEWQRRESPDGKPAGRLPYAIRRRDGRPMAFAGLWEVWRDRADPGAEPLRTCVIVTTSANDLMAPIHDRMPVVLAPEDWAAWLDPATDAATVSGLMVPAPSDWFEAFPVSTLVNKVSNDGPRLLDPLPPPPARAG